MASRDTPRGVSPVLGGVCADLLWKRSKAALSYSTPFLTPALKRVIGNLIFTPLGGLLTIKIGGIDYQYCFFWRRHE